MPPAHLNPVEARLADLGALWERFAADPVARVLRWVADADAREMVRVLIETQRAAPAVVPDVFVPFDVPFTTPDDYAPALLAAWQTFFDDMKHELIDESIDPTWRVERVRRGEPGGAAVARTASSFHRHFADRTRNVAIPLLPSAVADPAGWARWVGDLARADVPPGARFLVLDDPADPVLAVVAKASAGRIVTQTPAVNMAEVHRELLAEAGGSGPGVVFRKHYVLMLTAARERDLAAAEKSGRAALAVAAAEGWPDLGVAARLGLAGVFASAERPADSLAEYRAAVTLADTIAPDHPAAAVLGAQTRLAEASVHFTARRYADAAGLYEAAAPLAVAAGNDLLEMESWRMLAACRELLGAPEPAWAAGMGALAAGEKLPADVRGKSTLVSAGQGLLRLTCRRPFADRRDALVKTMNDLAGPGWEGRTP